MVKVYDELFNKIFLTELSLWLLQDCRFIASNIANGHTVPYGLEGTHRFLGSCIYRNNDGTAAKYWEYTHKEYIPVHAHSYTHHFKDAPMQDPWHSTERISDFFIKNAKESTDCDCEQHPQRCVTCRCVFNSLWSFLLVGVCHALLEATALAQDAFVVRLMQNVGRVQRGMHVWNPYIRV